jgi:hypothetical protein
MDCGHLAPARCSSQVGPSVVNFLNAQPAPMAMVRQIPSTSTSQGEPDSGQ